MAVAILVLQTFTVQRCTPGRAAYQKAASPTITSSLAQVMDTLETKHRIENIERDRNNVLRRVAGRRSNSRLHSAGLVDTFLQHLPGLSFSAIH